MKENAEENSDKSSQNAEKIVKKDTFWAWVLVFSAIITITISKFYKVFSQK